MVSKLINGDYQRDAQTRRPLTVDYIEELLQNAFVAISTRRSAFYPNKNFGSHIKAITGEPFEEYAFSYAAQAVDGIDGVYVKSAELCDGALKLKLLINNEERQVNIVLENNI